MGVVYSLYDRERKQYLSLGKKRGSPFQLDSDQIARFIADATYEADPARLEIHSDSGIQPEEAEQGWVCVGDFAHGRCSPCECRMCDPHERYCGGPTRG